MDLREYGLGFVYKAIEMRCQSVDSHQKIRFFTMCEYTQVLFSHLNPVTSSLQEPVARVWVRPRPMDRGRMVYDLQPDWEAMSTEDSAL